MKTFVLTLQFLTRIPININIKAEENDFAKGVVYFPIVGLIIGAFNLLIYYLVSRIFNGYLPVICCLIANTAITGALHIDGLADTCDGIFSSRNKEKMLEIMKDSRIGTNGTIAVILDFMLRGALLMTFDSNAIMYALLLSPVAAKTLVVLIMYFSKYARAQGMGGLFLGKQTGLRVVIGFILGLAVIFAFMRYIGLYAFLICIVAGFLYRAYIYSKIQGMTGDTLGAANEIIELVFLAAVLLFGRYGLI